MLVPFKDCAAQFDDSLSQVYRGVQRLLMEYKDRRRGPTVIVVQSPAGGPLLNQAIPALQDFPSVLVPHVDRWAGFVDLVATVIDGVFVSVATGSIQCWTGRERLPRKWFISF